MDVRQTTEYSAEEERTWRQRTEPEIHEEGVRLMAQLAYGMKERPNVQYGLTALCVGMGMGAALLWERL